MWNPFRRRDPSGMPAGQPANLSDRPRDDRSRWLITRAFQEIAGTSNGAVYDVPLALRPERIPGSIYLKDNPVWRSYLAARERADSGQPALLFSLRPLLADERDLVVEWGTTYPNTFFLVEPSDPRCDLSERTNPFTVQFDAAVTATAALAHHAGRPSDLPDGWTRSTPLGAFLREVFGTWVYWSGLPPYGDVHEVPLQLSAPDETLWERILDELEMRFPQPAFDRALAYVNDWEQELLGGPVPRARSVFRTRLGMPILRDGLCVDHAVRRLANQGRMTIIGASLPGRPIFGRGRPVPDDISDEEFVHFLMG